MDTRIKFRDFLLDVNEGLLFHGQDRVHVRPQAIKILTHLIAHQGELVSRRELASILWSDIRIDEDQGINAIIRSLRQVLGDDPTKPLYIETVPTKGYRFVADCVTIGVSQHTRFGRPREIGVVVFVILVLVLLSIVVVGGGKFTATPLTVDQIPIAARQAYVEGIRLYRKDGDRGEEESRVEFLKVVEMSPKFAEGHLYLGNSYLHARGTNLQHAIEAEPHIREAMRLNPDLPGVYVALGRIAMIKNLDPNTAAQHARKALQLEPGNTDALYLLYESRMVVDDISGAMEILDQIDNSDPTKLSDSARRGWLYFFTGEYELAIRECGDSLKLHFYNPFARQCLFEAYYALGAKDMARKIAASIMMINYAPSQDIRFVNTANVDDAIERFFSWRLRMVSQREGDNGDSYYYLISYWRLGRSDEAIEQLNKIVEERHYASLLRMSVDSRLELLAKDLGVTTSMNQFQTE